MTLPEENVSGCRFIGRLQSVFVDGHLSAPSSVNMGVLQGSVLMILGSPLFLLLLNVLSSITILTATCKTYMFAHDTELDTTEELDCSHILKLISKIFL